MGRRDLSPVEMHWVELLLEGLFSGGQTKRYLNAAAYADLAKLGLTRRSRVDQAANCAWRAGKVQLRVAGRLMVVELVPPPPAPPRRSPRRTPPARPAPARSSRR